MHRKYLAVAAALVLFAGVAPPGAAAADAAKAAPAAATPAAGKASAAKPAAPAKKKLVNLNAASREELKALPGGSDEEAARIIAGRPYNSKAFLLTNQIISQGRYGAIKALVVAGKPGKAVGAAK